MNVHALDIVGYDLRQFVRPFDDLIPARHRLSFQKRCKALEDVAGGASISAVAKHHHINHRTVRNDAKKAMQMGPDGRLLGYRACIPYRFRKRAIDTQSSPVPPHHKYACALTRLLASDSRIQKCADGYKGRLPDGRSKCANFDRHVKNFLALVRSVHGDDVYPFNTSDQGRRALLRYHQRKRQALRDAGAAEVEATEPSIKRFNQLFTLAPLDRVEFDAHKIDVDWSIEIPRPDGHIVTRTIQCISLLALVCAVSRYLISFVLVLGAYNRLDVLRLFYRALTPWRPRELLVPSMAYPEGAQLGLPADALGNLPRGNLIAGDNALAHHAELTVDNLLHHHRGILNFGHAHVPEGRPIIEAFNRRLEQGALRNIAGGFQPETRANGAKRATSCLRATDHPLHWEALLDLIDVIAAGYNVTPHSGLNNRTPASVLDTHLASQWTWKATDSSHDAKQLTTVRFTARIRGDKSSGRHPFVQFQEAHYRSQRLMGQWTLVGREFPAELNFEDLRHIVLLDPDDGTPWSRLTALPPWDRSRHDLHLRQQIIRARKRGLLEITGSADAIEAYHDFTREQALSGEQAPDLYAQSETQRTPLSTTSFNWQPPAVTPRAGFTSFAHRKD
jgi:putative transposase